MIAKIVILKKTQNNIIHKTKLYVFALITFLGVLTVAGGSLDASINQVTYLSDVKEIGMKFSSGINKLKKLDVKRDNLGIAYELSGNGLNLTRELEEKLINKDSLSASEIKALFLAAEFWKEVDRTIGDIDNSEDELLNLIKEIK